MHGMMAGLVARILEPGKMTREMIETKPEEI
jgi:hypothetical protein